MLPQSQAYKTLAGRLETASSLQQHLSQPSGGAGVVIADGEALGATVIAGVEDEGLKTIDFNYLLAR